MSEATQRFQVEQRVTVHKNVATIFFGVGEIIAIEGEKALVRWDNDKWKCPYWQDFCDLKDVEAEEQDRAASNAYWERRILDEFGKKDDTPPASA